MITKNEIIIEDPIHNFQFHSSLSHDGVLVFSIFLTNPYRQTRSYLRGTELFAFAIKHFDMENINEIRGKWDNHSDNYKQYSQALKQNFSKEEAARKTWTGKQALKFGFSEVEVSPYENSIVGVKYIMASFTRKP